MAHLEISLLGRFIVTLDDQPVTRFGTDKTRALLAYLIVERERAHRRAMLAGLLWPEVPEAAAHHNLSQALLMLRRILGDKSAPPEAPPFLLTTRQTLRFNPASDYILDVTAFQTELATTASSTPEQLTPAHAQQLAQAVARYRGEFLSDPWQINSVAFEEWRLVKQTQLHLLVVEALGALVHYHLQHHEYPLAAHYAREQIALAPLHESAHRQLMLALALDGRRSEALVHYAACQTLLSKELGIAPAPETTTLAEEIRADCVTIPESAKVQPAGTKTAPPAPAPPFVGRKRELARLEKALAATVKGQGQIMLITGTAGSGKTALLNVFARRALAVRADVLVISSSGNAYTGPGAPYWPFIELLRGLQGETDTGMAQIGAQAQRLEKARPIITRALAACAPDLSHLLSGVSLVGNTPSLERACVFDQITRTLQAVATHSPLVLLLDDLQWADRDTLNLLFHLSRRLAGLRLLIVGTLRSEVLTQGYSTLTYLYEKETGQQHPLAALVNELQRYLGDIKVDLAQAAGQAFIDALLDSEPNHLGAEFRETLYQHTEGHALFTMELLRGMQERGDLVRDAQGYWVENRPIAWQALPTRVEAVIATRLSQIPPEWQTLLTLASVEGDEFTVQVLAGLQNLDETETTHQLSGALARQYSLVIPVGVRKVGDQRFMRYRFRHLLFQKYLYNQLDPVERAQLHLSVGCTLEALYGQHASIISLSLARHFELGGEVAKSVTYLLQAGRHAIQLAASEEALRLLTRGLTLLGRLESSPEREQIEVEFQMALATAFLAKGWNAPERAQASIRAYELCQRVGALDQLARSLLLLADVHLVRGQFSHTAAIAQQLQVLSQSTGDPLIHLITEFVWGSLYFFKGQLVLARQHLEKATTLYTADPHPQAALAEIDTRSQSWLSQTLWLLGYAEQAIECSQRTIANARVLGHTFALATAISIGELSLRQCRREPEAMRTALRQLAALGSDAHLNIYRLWAALFQGWLAAVEAHEPAGLHQIQHALDRWEADETQGGRIFGYVLLSEAYLALGQVEAARVTVEQSLAQSTEIGLRFFEAELLRLQGETQRILGHTTEAETCFLHAIAVAQAQSAKAWELRAAMSLCRLLRAKGTPAQIIAGRQQLSEVYTWFTEGLDTPDLQAAATLLAEMTSGTGLGPTT
ncbi:MAG: AAA family ATPase [Anaerolineae bacterium]|nr:AAA family ATPase [Anaerolineae bacterium]